jgi:carbon starvation protein
MLYRWKMDLIVVTLIAVGVVILSMIAGVWGAQQKLDDAGQPIPGQISWVGPVNKAVVVVNNGINAISGGKALMVVTDPTNADPRIPAPGADGKRTSTALYNADTGAINTLPSYLFWALFLLVFAYLASTLPIWRFAQPVNYIGFWITLLTIGLAALGAVLAPIIKPAVGAFALSASKLPDLGFAPQAGAPWFPIWPMLFVTIACGAISGWHALFGSIGTARQLEYETDALPVGGGAMFTEFTLALLSLTAVSIAGAGGGAGRFAAGVGSLFTVLFGEGFRLYGTALGFGVFMVIVLTVTQLVFRVMRVTLSEWAGDTIPFLKNIHISTVTSMVLTMALVLTGTWVFLWQLFGASNQLMAALSLLIVTVWLKSKGRNPGFAMWPMLFMYVTTMAATLVTAYNLYVTIVMKAGVSTANKIGAWAMILISILLFVTAIVIAWDGYKAYRRYTGGEAAKPAPATAGD